MARKPQKSDGHGSLKQMQVLVNQYPELINQKIEDHFPEFKGENIEWLSPIKEDEYAEYTDQDFITKLDLHPDEIKLDEFWPTRGANWDGLAKTDSGKVILVEAKANIPEMVSPPSGASKDSLLQIQLALEQTKNYIGKGKGIDWSKTFYQYTNRIAHLYYLRVVRKKPVFLVNIYFIGDKTVDGPKTEEEWKGAIQVMQLYLGLHHHKLKKYMADIFIDVKELI
tara:strand:- start:10265 stop:10939 length:675 start_codon:yes stop_codon:yes gene_type:complete